MEAEPFPGEVRIENLLLFLPTLSKNVKTLYVLLVTLRRCRTCQNFDRSPLVKDIFLNHWSNFDDVFFF